VGENKTTLPPHMPENLTNSFWILFSPLLWSFIKRDKPYQHGFKNQACPRQIVLVDKVRQIVPAHPIKEYWATLEAAQLGREQDTAAHN